MPGKQKMNKFAALTALLLIAALGVFSIIASGPGGDGPGGTLATTRDAQGVWFVSGPDETALTDVFDAVGYAVAVDRLWQAELYRRQARGTLAEIFGQGYLGNDVAVRVLGYSTAELTDAFNNLDTISQNIINGYVAGFNRRLAEIAEDDSLLPFEFKQMGFSPAEWTVEDILAWVALLQRNFDPEALDQGQIDNLTLYQELMAAYGAVTAAGMFEDLRWTNDPDAVTYIPAAIPDQAAKSPASKTSALAASNPVNLGSFGAQLAALNNQNRENLKKINALAQMGSYAWVVAGSKTEDGLPIIYSGPQMGFYTPSIVMEGSIRAGGMQVSGMTVPGIPGIIIGRTPHHAWSMQVGHGHAVDFYVENPADVTLNHNETFTIAGAAPVTLPIYRTTRGPVINTLLDQAFDPAAPAGPVISYKYAHRDYEFHTIRGFYDLAMAQSMDQFGAGIERLGVCQHFCYADRDSNIAYWMSGRDPERGAGEWRLPQGSVAAALDWDAGVLRERSTDRNTTQGYYCGWNNKTNPNYDNTYNGVYGIYGPFHRAHVVDDYLRGNNDLTYEQVRDLALNIATTDSFHGGGNPWSFVSTAFVNAVTNAGLTADRQAALDLMAAWDGHFVDGGAAEWPAGTDRADAWMLMDAWLEECLRLTFADELQTATLTWEDQPQTLLFNVFLHGLGGYSITNNYDWFANLADAGAPQTAGAIIVQALDTVLAGLGAAPWGTGARGEISYRHDLLGEVWTSPYSNRSTFAHCIQYGSSGPVRIESMFPLGESGDILEDDNGAPAFNAHFFTMTPYFDAFSPRTFPLFE